ncbi:MAG: HAD family hydrolase [Clostridia bacterium]|nr:HAD family hydrolase [Clostridia bacterium]
MKTLYISDLDGTLLNTDAEISPYTAERLNYLIEKGLNFSIATARTNATVVQMLRDVNINIPVILMNGVATYDLKNDRYVDVKPLTHNAKAVLFAVIKNHIKSGFVYTIDENGLNTYYENTDSPNAIAFIEERQKKYNKKFTKVRSFEDCMDKPVVYYSIDDKKEVLEDAYEQLKKCSELRIEFYRDIYNTDHWYLEVCSSEASKRNAVITLKKMYGFERVICFGDNLNDLPMFEVCDEAYAVMNAKEEVKAQADGIIGSNNENAVVKFLEKSITL